MRSVPVLARTVTWTGCQARDTWRDGQNLGQIGGVGTTWGESGMGDMVAKQQIVIVGSSG